MPRPGKDRYHHGDLRAALIDTAAELIAERGVRGFSLAAMARAYVRFAAGHRPMFEMLYESGLDKARHPEIEAAERAARATLALIESRGLLVRGRRDVH